MDDRTDRLWTGVRKAIVRHLHESGDGQVAPTSAMHVAVWGQLRDLANGPGGWTDEGTWELLRSRLRLGEGNPLADPLGGTGGTTAYRAARLAHVVVIQGLGAVRPGERRLVREALGRTDVLRGFVDGVPDDPVPVPVPTSGPQEVAFRFPYVRPGPSGRGRASVGVGDAVAHVPSLPPSEAPVVCRLRTRDGGWFGLRRTASGFVRPVMAPGEWRPLSLEEFGRHAATCPAWVDNPFLERVGPSQGVLALDDVASGEPGPRRADDARRATEAVAARRRADRLCVIDGIVHVATGEPSLHLASRSLFSGESYLGCNGRMVAWSLEDDVDMCTDMAPDRTISASPVIDRRLLGEWCGAGARDLRSSLAVANRHPSGLGPSFGMGDLAAAVDALERCGAENEWMAGPWVTDAPVTDVDPLAFPVDPLRLHREVRALHRMGHPVWSRALSSADGDMHDDLRDLRAFRDHLLEAAASRQVSLGLQPSIRHAATAYAQAVVERLEAHLEPDAAEAEIDGFRP